MEAEGAFFNISDYELHPEKLGEGAYGTVYVVKNAKNNQKYAAKIINVKNGFDGNDQKLFLRESLTLHTLDHPCIVKFVGINFGSFKDPNLLEPSIITEYLSKGSLKSNLNNEKRALSDGMWNPTKKYIILLGISDALRYLHKNKILHRDLKPENILLDEKLQPRVCDFGLSKCFSKSLNKSTKLTISGQFGTPLYLPPEILRGDENYDQSVDVYAFAMILYEIVTGQEPYSELGESISPFKLIQRIINGYRPKFTRFVTKKMQNLLSRCWSDRPEERPTFDEIFEKLSKDFSYFDEDVDEEEIEDFIDMLNECRSKESDQNKDQEENESEIKRLSSIEKSKEKEHKKLKQELKKLKNKIDEYDKEKDVLSKTNNLLNNGLRLILGNKKYRNAKSAVHFLQNSSRGGNRYSSFILGLLYESGDIVEYDMKKAFQYYEISYNQGNSSGYTRIGYCYDEGEGVKRDYSKAIKYYEQAAELGNSTALFNLGYHYAEGIGVKQDYSKAIKYYEQSAELGNSGALFNLGYHYEEGKGVKQDYSKAIKYYEQAAELGDSNSLYNLGYHYAKGEGVKQDYSKAIKYYEQSAELGNSNALFNLGYHYEEGKGVKQDYSKAIKYYEQSAELGDEDAKTRINSIKKLMKKK